MLMFSMFLSEQVVPQVKQGCYIQYHRLFRDRSRGTTYLEYWADNWMQVHKLVPGAGVLPIIAGSPPPTVANCTTKASCEATCEGVATCPSDGTVYCCADKKNCGGQHACPGTAGLVGCACLHHHTATVADQAGREFIRQKLDDDDDDDAQAHPPAPPHPSSSKEGLRAIKVVGAVCNVR